MAITKQNSITSPFKIVDTGGVMGWFSTSIILYGLGAFCGIAFLVSMCSLFGGDWDGLLWMLIFGPIAFISTKFAPLCWQNAKNYNLGYQIDINKNTFSFPGGFIEPNDVSELFTKKFLMQFFETKRTVQLSEISAVKHEKGTKNIVLTGTFGHIRLMFGSEEKCYELYIALVQVIHAGAPVVVR